jgi:hypothetical protein
MITLIVASLVLTAFITLLALYLRLRPPDLSTAGKNSLNRGLILGAISAAGLLLSYVAMYRFPLVGPGISFPFLVVAIAGNILNMTGEVKCLQELSGETLFAALLLALTQILWIFCALHIMTADF